MILRSRYRAGRGLQNYFILPSSIGRGGRLRQRFSFNFPGFVYKQILIILGLYDSLSNFLSNHRFCFLKNASVFVFLTKEDLGGSGQGRGRSRQAVGQVETSMKRAGQVATLPHKIRCPVIFY